MEQLLQSKKTIQTRVFKNVQMNSTMLLTFVVVTIGVL